MRDDHFEWDDKKSASNARKHRVSFDNARAAFDDPHAILEPDDDPDEDRWKCIGMTAANLVVVIHVERDTRIRIISARKAEKHEQDQYNGQASFGR